MKTLTAGPVFDEKEDYGKVIQDGKRQIVTTDFGIVYAKVTTGYSVHHTWSVDKDILKDLQGR